MLNRVNQWGPLLYLALCTVSPANADDKPKVSLILSKATALRDTNAYFGCEFVIENSTGKEVKVQSNFYSAFDWLKVIVTTKDGKVLAQQSQTLHQSPRAEKSEFLIKNGRTSDKVGIVVPNFPKDVSVVKIRLVGTLPDNEKMHKLETEAIEIEVKSKK